MPGALFLLTPPPRHSSCHMYGSRFMSGVPILERQADQRRWGHLPVQVYRRSIRGTRRQRQYFFRSCRPLQLTSKPPESPQQLTQPAKRPGLSSLGPGRALPFTFASLSLNKAIGLVHLSRFTSSVIPRAIERMHAQSVASFTQALIILSSCLQPGA